METYCGHVRSPADAIKLFEACRLGLLPRVQRRLSEKERQSIKSGSVFVWDEREAGMRRWTDGKSWSASRVSGSFLTYREMEGKRGGGGYVQTPARRGLGKTPDSGRGSDEDQDMDAEPDGYRYKADGLMKQSFSITTSTGQHLHLISYFARPNTGGAELPVPTSDPILRHIVAPKGMYPESTVQEQAQGSAATRSPMPGPYPPQPMMAGPPNSRAPYPYQMAASYGWPPSPVATPPYQYQNGHYIPGGTLPGMQHASPHQYPPPPGSQPAPPPYTQAGQQGHDGLPPQSSSHSSLLPPLSSSSSGHQGPPPHEQYIYQPSQHPDPARLVAESQAQQAQRAGQSAGPPACVIDPRITATAAAAIAIQQANGPSSRQGSESPQTASPKDRSTTQVSPSSSLQEGQPTSQPQSQSQPQPQPQAQNIPSISSLVHAENHGSDVIDPSGSAGNTAGSRAGSVSPQQRNSGEGDGGRPQDIPHDKMRFGGEDKRALRVLDRKFCI